jgi:hypothetical protein
MTDHKPTVEAFRQFQYPTAPLKVGSDHMNKMLRSALDRAFVSEEQ